MLTWVAAVSIAGLNETETSAWTLTYQPLFETAVESRLENDTLILAPAPSIRKNKHWMTIDWSGTVFDLEDEALPGNFEFGRKQEEMSLKQQILQKLGLREVKTRGFGATFRFSGAPNWAFQLRGTKKLTVAYITKF